MWYGKAGTAHWREPLVALCIKDAVCFFRFMCWSLAENSYRIFRPLLSFVWMLLIIVGLLSAEKPPPKALCISSTVYKQRNARKDGKCRDARSYEINTEKILCKNIFNRLTLKVFCDIFAKWTKRKIRTKAKNWLASTTFFVNSIFDWGDSFPWRFFDFVVLSPLHFEKTAFTYVKVYHILRGFLWNEHINQVR